MADNKEYAVQQEENGTINISEEVIATIAATAAKDVDGVNALTGSIGDDIAGILGKKHVNRGVRIQLQDDGVVVECNVEAKYGAAVVEMAKNVQAAVSSAIESMTGLKVKNVAVNIVGIAVNPTK